MPNEKDNNEESNSTQIKDVSVSNGATCSVTVLIPFPEYYIRKWDGRKEIFTGAEVASRIKAYFLAKIPVTFYPNGRIACGGGASGHYFIPNDKIHP